MKKGAAILLSVMIISLIILIVGVSITTANLIEKRNRQHYSGFFPIAINSEGCAEESLLRLNRDDTYIGENIMINSTVCDIYVTGEGDSRTLTVEAIKEEYVKKLRIDVIINPSFTITSWQENPA